MRKMCTSLSDLFRVALLLLIGPQGISAEPVPSQIENQAQENDDIAHGHMGSGSASPRSSGGGGVRLRGGGGGTYIHGGGGGGGVMTPQSPYIYSQPGSPIYNEGIPTEEEPEEEEEPPLPIHELPSFNLSAESTTVHTGEPATLKISDVQASEPVTIFWHWGDDEWETGDTTFHKKPTKPGKVPVSVVIQDGEGLYSQTQTIEIDVQPQPQPTPPPPSTPYYDTMPPQDNTPPQTETPPKDNKEPPPTDEQTAIDIFGITPLDKEQRARLKKDLEKSYLDHHQLEEYIQADLRIRASCEAKLTEILLNRKIGEDTPSKEEQGYSDCLIKVNKNLQKAQNELDRLKKNIETLDGILK